MSQTEQIKEALSKVMHPETGKDIISAGIVDEVSQNDNLVSITLAFTKKRDPFAKSIIRQIEEVVSALLPETTVNVSVKEPATAPRAEQQTTTGEIKHVIAISSGKGGVGKSTVTANLAVTLKNMGYKVGVLDADIYGPSMPKMFGLEGYAPEALVKGEEQYILPAESDGIKIMSIGFFISPDDALIWRGPMANSALKQLIHQTMWEELDFLLIDLPPGTGDIHLSLISELKIDGAVVVSTPQQIAIADARRGIKMFRSQGVDVPVLGIIENMAWFSPAELPDNRYYLFGKEGARNLARTEGVTLLGEVPIIQSVMESADAGNPAVSTNSDVKEYYRKIASEIVNKLPK